ncbi:hypothetical protein JCM3775_006581 [Rhodotorula graminis]
MQHPSQSPSAWLAAPSPSSSLLPPAAAAAPPPPPHLPRQRALSTRPSLAPPAPPGPATSHAASSLATPHSADPATEARRAVALLVGAPGPGAAEGLLDRVQRDIDSLLAAYERAFDAPSSSSPSPSPSPSPSHALDSLDALVSLLSRSAPGGFVPSTTTPDSAPLAQAHLDRASERAQALFREGVRLREGAEVVRAGLSG